MRFSLLCLLMGLLCTGVRAQCPTNLTINTDQDVNDFLANFPNCTDLQGNLTIDGPDVSSVAGLTVLTKISGNLLISKVNMTDIKGLENITSVGQDFTITDCANLSGNGFSAGLGVQDIGGFLFINNLPNVNQFPPFDNLSILSSGFGSNAVGILGLAPLSGVTGTMERVVLTNNPALRNMNGLSNVETISSYKAKGNGGLREINELSATITDTLILEDNPVLPNCATAAVCNALANDNTYKLISNNPGNCGSVAIVAAICNNCHPDYEPLVAIYNAANGDNWTNNTNWLTDCDVCNWFGVTCDANDRIERLELPDNNLVGTLAPEIAELTEVKWLRFNNNTFTGGVPNLISLDKLERLRLHRSGFSGSLPILGNKQNLTHLELYDNNFSGSIPGSYSGSRFPALRFLYLDRNELTGTPPTSIATMTNLEEFNAHTNNLTGCYPDEYSALCGLNSILFFNNAGLPDGGSTDFFTNEFCANGTECALCDHPDFEGLMEFYDATNGATWTDNSGWADGAAGDNCEPCTWFGVTCDANDRVTEISLPANNLTGTIPPQISLLTALRVLQVSFNSIGGQLPDALWFNDLLEEVYVHNNSIGGQFPDIGNHPGLRIVTASNNDFFGQIPIVGNIPNMIRMMFANCDFTAEIPAGYNPTNMPLFNQFSVQGNDIFAELPEGLGDYPAGQLNISLASNNFVGCYPANYESFCGETFRFDGNPQLPDTGSDAFFEDQFCAIGTGCPLDCHPDYEVLALIYAGTNGDDWTDNTNWLTDCDVCDWFGVFCNPDGRVTALNLINNNLVGTLPNRMDEVDELIGINLSINNGLTGAIPSSLFELGSIANVNLVDNDFTGGIPVNIGQAITLQVLQLNNSSNLGGTLPAGLFELTGLEFLTMTSCGITGPLPDGITDLTNLRVLELGGNNFTGNLPTGLGSLTGLTRLWLNNNDFDGELPASLANLTNLTNLLLNSNDLTGCYPSEYSVLCGIDQIGFSNNAGLPDGGSNNFFENTFCSTGQTCDGPCHPDFDALIALYNATAGANWTDNTGWVDGAAGTDCDVCDWFGVACNNDGRVITISLGDNNLVGSLPVEIGELERLDRLNLAVNSLSGSIPGSIGDLAFLQVLNLHENELTGGIPAALGSLPAVLILNIYNNQLGGSIPTEIGNATTLVNLDIRNNDLVGSPPSSLGQLVNLSNFNISNNELTGAPPKMNNQPSLARYAASSNLFTGPIPEDLVNSTVINNISLSNNQLSGPLPELFGNLAALTQLFLQGNQFSGCYPANYSDLCGDNTNFLNNPNLPDGGSDDFFDNTFCTTGQTCAEDCPTNLTINSTQDITDYMAQYPNCTVLQGNLIIDGPNIQTGNLNNRLDTVYGDVQVRNLSTTSAPGFQGIRYIGNDFIVEDCPNLGTNGFGGTLQLNTVGQDVRITDLPTIQTISPLVNLASVGRILAITRTAISTLNGLQGLAGTVPILRIQDNDQLTDLTALANLTARGPSLEEVSAIVITENDVLISLNGLEGFVVPGSMFIQDNPLLVTCEVMTVCNKIAAGDNLAFILNNAPGCDTNMEVETACNALPVTWQYFNATVQPKWVDLDWATSEETNNAYFDVERSADGRQWAPIGRVVAAANQRYTHKDTEPLAGENYYRLRQVDYDEAFTFSEVRRVSFSGNVALAWPNPVGEEFNLYSELPQEIDVFDAVGRRVRTIQHLGGGAQVQRRLEGSGVYLLRFRSGGQTVRLILK